MDSEHRHELQENDLAEFFAHFGEWWQKYGNITLIVVMAIVLAVAGWRFISFRSAQAHENAWTDLAFATSPETFRAVAQSHDNPAVKTLAYLHGGDLLLGQAITGETPALPTSPQDDTDASPGAPAAPLDRDALLSGARTLYEQALQSAPHVVYRINAHLGLASVAETQSRWDDARQHYEQAIEAAGAGFATLAEQARIRLDMLSNLRQPVVFAPDAPAAGDAAAAVAPVIPQAAETADAGDTPDAPDASVTPDAPDTPAAAPAPEASSDADGQ